MEAGVLAFHREGRGATRLPLISKKAHQEVGYPQREGFPDLSFAETAAKEALKEAVVTASLVGMFRAKKRVLDSWSDHIIEVWVYLL